MGQLCLGERGGRALKELFDHIDGEGICAVDLLPVAAAASAEAPLYTCYTTFVGDTEVGAGFAARTTTLLFENADGAWRVAPGVAPTPELEAHAADLDTHQEELGLFWIAGEHPAE